MSPASKSKSKDKSAARPAKEQQKPSSKPSVTPVNGGTWITASGYNPVSGTIHALETSPSTMMPTPNGRFRTIDETEEHSGTSLSTVVEYDSVSNNDSCSGESEDQQKERCSSATSRSEPILGSDADKREKIRLKNEKKHQRQRERRTQELHERCCSYLTSRKLELLDHKLVAMGFTLEQATMALIQNEGRVDESVLWLLEGGEESKQQAAASTLNGANPKIDIADELTRIADMELNFKCTKQEVERIVVACEGDLEKTEETLKAQKQETPFTPPKSEESSDPPTTVSSNGYYINSSTPATSTVQNSIARTPLKGASPSSVQLQRRDDRDFYYTKFPTISRTTTAQMEAAAASRHVVQQPLQKVQQSKLPDWMKSHAAVVPPVQKRWPATTSSTSTAHSPLASPLQVSATQLKTKIRYVPANSNEVKTNLVSGSTLREPIFVMQRSQQSNGTRQNVPPALANGSSAMEAMKMANVALGQQLRDIALKGSNSSQQFYPQSLNQQFISPSPMESNGGSGWSGGSSYTRSSSSSTSLAVPSSLGLFTGWPSSGSRGSSYPVDWSTQRGSMMPQCDYTSIDWSLDSTPLSIMPSSYVKAERLYDNTWHASYTSSKAGRPSVNGGGEVRFNGLQDGSYEGTSPFAGKDLFRVPRKYVTSPSR